MKTPSPCQSTLFPFSNGQLKVEVCESFQLGQVAGVRYITKRCLHLI